MPTPTLTGLLSQATGHKSSYLDPRPTNPLGRRAPIAVFSATCEQHRFEVEILPEAEEKGWPKSIEWGVLRGRVEKMKGALHSLIYDQSGSCIKDGDDDNADEEKGPRSSSIFWREVVKDVEKQGLRVFCGVQGQYANFQRTYPG